jgi:hypothetical protein
MFARIFLVLMSVALLPALIACGGGDDDDSSQTSQSEVCDDLDAVRDDLDEARGAALRGDPADAQTALNDARTKLTTLRDDVRSGPAGDAAAQSVADLIGAIEGMQTTLRQVGQGGGSLQGFAQEMLIQLMAMFSSISSLRGQLNCG